MAGGTSPGTNPGQARPELGSIGDKRLRKEWEDWNQTGEVHVPFDPEFCPVHWPFDLERIGPKQRPVCKSAGQGLQIELVDDDISRWRASFAGPADTPYHGGTFVVQIDAGPDYPWRPVCRFLTCLHHPYIAGGHVQSLLIQSDPYGPQRHLKYLAEWSVSATLPLMFAMMRLLLRVPLETEADNRLARLYTQRFAGAPISLEGFPPLFELAACSLPQHLGLCGIPDQLWEQVNTARAGGGTKQLATPEEMSRYERMQEGRKAKRRRKEAAQLARRKAHTCT